MAKSGAARERPPDSGSGGTSDAKGSMGQVRGRQALQLDRVIHERTRLAIVSALAVNDSLSFSELKKLLGVTDGNLSVHARKLEEAGYIECTKTFERRVPKTKYRLSAAGGQALQRYLAHMEALIEATRDR